VFIINELKVNQANTFISLRFIQHNMFQFFKLERSIKFLNMKTCNVHESCIMCVITSFDMLKVYTCIWIILLINLRLVIDMKHTHLFNFYRFVCVVTYITINNIHKVNKMTPIHSFCILYTCYTQL